MDSPEFINLKRDVRAILISVQQGLTPVELERDYRTMLGKPMPYRNYGYDTVYDLVKAIPDVVEPYFKPGGVLVLKAKSDPSTDHIAKLVSQQRKSSKVSRIRAPVMAPPPRSVVPYKCRVKIKELMKSYPGGINASLIPNAFAKRFGGELKYKSLGFATLKALLVDCSDILRLEDKDNTLVVFLKDNVEAMSEQLLQKMNLIKQQSTANKSAIESKESVNETEATSILEGVSHDAHNKLISHQSKQYQAAKMNSGRIDLSQPDGYLEKSKLAGNGSGGVAGLSVGISDQIQRELKLVIAKRPNGIWSARLPFEYKQMFNKPLVVQDLGFNSVIELAGSLPHIVQIERPAPNSDWLLFSSDAEICKSQIVPKSAAGPDDTYKPHEMGLEGEFILRIVFIEDPSLFWARLGSCEDEHSILMEKLQDFYSSREAQQFLLPDAFRKPGQVCCAMYEEDGSWYRAEIIGVKSTSTTEVLYSDYGNHAVVSNSKLRLLSREFLSAPKHAMKAKLFNVKPAKKPHWSQDAVDYFYNLTHDRRLFGQCKRVQDDCAALDIVDTNSDKDLYINCMMVVKGFAEYESRTDPVLQTGGKDLFSAGVSTASTCLNVLNPQQIPTGNQSQLDAMNYISACYMYQLTQMQAHLAQLQNSMRYPNQLMQQPSMPNIWTQTQNRMSSTEYNKDEGVRNTGHQKQSVTQREASFVQGSVPKPQQAVIPIERMLNCDSHIVTDKGVSDVKMQHASVSNTWTEMQNQMSFAGNNKADNAKETMDEKESVANKKTGFSQESVPRPQPDIIPIERNHDCTITDNGVSCVKKLELPENYVLHLIKHDSHAYVSSGEISALFWQRDLLRAMLRQKQVNYPKVTIGKDDYKDLFEELMRRDVIGLVEKGEPKKFLTLYELEGLPSILALFNHKSQLLRGAIQDLVSHYKHSPNTIWQDEIDNQNYGDDIEDDSEDLELELEALTLLKQAMQFKRKRLCNALLAGKSTQDKVETLKQVEKELEEIRVKIKTKGGTV